VEDIFEALIAIGLVIFAFARKNRKKKAAGQNREQGFKDGAPADADAAAKAAEAPEAKKKASAVSFKLDKAMQFLDEWNEKGFDIFEDDAPKSGAEKKAVPVIPVAAVAPAAPAPQPVPVVPVMGMEGECEHPEHAPVVREVEKAVNAIREAGRTKPPAEPEAVSPRMTAVELRRAVIAAEVLDRPLALRPRGRRM
jgi:hypothetical protein